MMINIVQKTKKEKTSETILAVLKAEKEGLQLSLEKEKMQCVLLKQEMSEADVRNSDLYKVCHMWTIFLVPTTNPKKKKNSFFLI